MVCYSWGRVGSGPVDLPTGRMELGEGQPRPKVTVLLLPWKQPPLYREPGRERGG